MNLSMMHFHKCLDKSQTDSRTGIVNIYLIKAVKYMLYMFGRHTYTGIGYLQPEIRLTVLIKQTQLNGNTSVFRSKLKGIGQQIVHNTLHLFRIGHNRIISILIHMNTEADMFAERKCTESVTPFYQRGP